MRGMSGAGCLTVLLVFGVIAFSRWLDLPGWLTVVLIIGGIFTALGATVIQAYQDAQEAQREYFKKKYPQRTPWEDDR